MDNLYGLPIAFLVNELKSNTPVNSSNKSFAVFYYWLCLMLFFTQKENLPLKRRLI